MGASGDEARQEAGPGRRERKRERTRRAMIDGAQRLLERGHAPTVAEAAREASLSRATGYRYFTSQHELLTAVMDEQMQEVRAAVDGRREDVVGRLEALVRADYRMRSSHEPAFRTRLALAVRQRGKVDEEFVPRGWRIRAIADALAHLRGTMSPERLRRLEAALSVLVGTEAFLILKDLWDMGEDESEDVLVWACRSLLASALEEEAEDVG